MSEYHSLLQRQLRKLFGRPDQYPEQLESFLQAVNSAYHDFETDLRLLQHSLDLSSEELLHANSELRAIFQALPDVLFHMDAGGTILNCKGGSAADSHLPLSELAGKHINSIPIKSVADKFRQAHAQVQETGAMAVSEYSIRHHGKDNYYEIRLLPLPEGHSVAIVRNITGRKQIETALQESERRLADIINFLPDATFAIDLEGKIIAWNHAIEEMTDCSARKMIGKGDNEYAMPFYGRRIPILIDLVLNPSLDIQGKYSNYNKEGDILVGESYLEDFGGKYCWAKASPLYDSDGNIVGAIETVRDISDRRKIEKDLLDSGERLKKQQAMLVELTHNKVLFLGDLAAAIREITEASARTLDVGQVSVWLFNDEQSSLVCIDLYERAYDRHSDGLILNVVDHPEYFKAVDQERVVAVTDANNDLRTKSFVNSYFKPYGISSMMDVPILVSGHTIGVVCYEHVGGCREWTADEQSFAASIADLVSLSFEVAERKKAETDLRIRTSAMNAANDQIVITNIRGGIEFVNPSFERETGYTLSEVEGELPDFLISDKHDSEFYHDLWESVLNGKTWHGEITLYRKNGSTVVEDVTITPIKNENKVVERFIAIKRNITDKKVYEQKLDHLAHHDHLTGLPNRLLFSDRLTQCLAHSEHRKTALAVLFLDLDRFKLINDSLGHSVGDLLLKAAAERLQGNLREADMIARMGGDEFTIILSSISDANEIASVTSRVAQIMSAPFVLGGQELFVTTSIGVSIYPTDGDDVETLVKNADSAMYRAKEQGRNNYQFYTEALNTAAVEKMQLESSLRKAIERDEFVLHYQPRVDVKTGAILGVEALVRWRHPEMGLIPPAAFIPLAEETGLIEPIGRWVMRTACAQNKKWQTDGLDPISVAVNVSGRQFVNGSLTDDVSHILFETGLDPQFLDLELTESVLMHSIDLAIVILRKFKEMGVRLSIDDFGTGYSSLTYLKRFPIDAVKIDQSFIRDLTTNSDDAAIARAVIAMSQSLKLKVIAEGVETIDQLQVLQSMACDEIQGYFISRPLPAGELESIMRDHTYLIDSDYLDFAA
ncbi:EAL domain-containing protein [bacterium]|nr:EAL domain-containing protein [bacterium]